MLEGFRPRGMIGRVALMCVLPCALFLTVPATAQDDQEEGRKGKKKTYIQRVSARAFSLAENTNDTVRVEIGIARWSTDEERQTLVKALVDGGTPEITKARSRARISASFVSATTTPPSATPACFPRVTNVEL